MQPQLSSHGDPKVGGLPPSSDVDGTEAVLQASWRVETVIHLFRRWYGGVAISILTPVPSFVWDGHMCTLAHMGTPLADVWCWYAGPMRIPR